MKINLVNALNDGMSIEISVGMKEYTLRYDEEKTIEIEDEDYFYFDTVYPCTEDKEESK